MYAISVAFSQWQHMALSQPHSACGKGPIRFCVVWVPGRGRPFISCLGGWTLERFQRLTSPEPERMWGPLFIQDELWVYLLVLLCVYPDTHHLFICALIVNSQPQYFPGTLCVPGWEATSHRASLGLTPGRKAGKPLDGNFSGQGFWRVWEP